MDSITQGLLGATVSECGFRHKLGRGGTLMGALGGVLPDLDIFTGWINPWSTWQYHRHFTHSVFFAPLVAGPLAWLFWRRGGRRRFGMWYLCAYLVLATHPVLDLFTSYGTQLFAPIWNARFGLDWIAIIDPLYTLVLLVAVIGAVVLRRFGRSASTWRLGLAGMVLSTGYICYGALNHAWAMDRIHERVRQEDHQVLAARAIPNVGSVYVWRLIYRTRSGYYIGRTNTRFDHTPSFVHLPIKDHPLIRKADDLPRIRLFRSFTMGWARPTVERKPAGWIVVYDDMRYGWPPDNPRSLWSAVVVFDPNGSPQRVARASHRRGGRRSAAELWREFWRQLGRP